MKATIYDVAEAAGLSIATVSYVMNGKRKVGEKTKAKVLTVMEQLNFHPNVGVRVDPIHRQPAGLCALDSETSHSIRRDRPIRMVRRPSIPNP